MLKLGLERSMNPAHTLHLDRSQERDRRNYPRTQRSGELHTNTVQAGACAGFSSLVKVAACRGGCQYRSIAPSTLAYITFILRHIRL